VEDWTAPLIPLPGANGTVNDIVVQPDGKILIAGGFTTYNSTPRKYIARLNSDGSLDTSFDSSTGANSDVNVVAVQSDGKILIGGGFTAYNSTTRNYVARLNSNGSLDTNFNPSTGANNIVWDLAVQPADNKVVIVGRFTSYNNTTRSKIARLNTDGSLDTTFDPGLGVNANLDIYRVTLQPDGKVLIGGDFLTFNGTTRIRIARLNSAGSLDTSFDPGTTSANNGVRPILVQPDGKILTAGDFTTFSGASRNHLTRLNSDGTLDTSFDVGTGANDFVGAIALQPDGRILIGGRFSTYNGTTANRLARLGNTTQVSWGDGDSAPKTIKLNIVDDNLVEGNEQLTLTLASTTNGSALGSPVSATLTIVDNDFPTVTAVSGSGQSTVAGTAFSQPLVVKVSGLTNTTVTFRAPASGASGTFAGGSTTYIGTTDSTGTITSTTFTANTIAGTYTVSATVSGVATPASFTLTNLAGSAANLVVVSGDGQSATINTAFSAPLVAKVTDASNNLVSGATVTFTASASSASGTFAGGSLLYAGTTDANGLVTATTFTANNMTGTFVVTATVAGVATPASFQLTNQCNPLVVTSGGDDGSCGTLRGAIQYANYLIVNHDVTITVNTSVITLTSELPAIQNIPDHSLILDGGCVASGRRGVPQTQLKAGAPNIGTGLQLVNHIKVRGFKITGFSSAGVVMNGSNTLSCSWIGTADGTTAAPNSGVGVSLTGSNNTVGGSTALDGVLISGNSGVGLGATGGTGNLVQNVWIGLAKDGTTALRNSGGGLKAAGGERLHLGRGNYEGPICQDTV
jgi:uncharacterized delta-60 repeat protein